MIAHVGKVLVAFVVLRGLYFSRKSNKKISEAEAEGTAAERRAKFLEARALTFKASVLTGFWLFLLAAGVLLQGLGAAIPLCNSWFGEFCGETLSTLGIPGS